MSLYTTLLSECNRTRFPIKAAPMHGAAALVPVGSLIAFAALRYEAVDRLDTVTACGTSFFKKSVFANKTVSFMTQQFCS